MNPHCSFIIPGTPMPKARHRVGIVNGRLVKYAPSEMKLHERDVRWLALQSLGTKKKCEGPIRLVLEFYLSCPKSWSNVKKNKAYALEIMPSGKPDIDNFAKTIMDACNGILWRDDAQIVELVAQKRYAEHASTCVSVYYFEA